MTTVQKQDYPTVSQSQNLVQNLFGTSIATIASMRHLLPDSDFSDVSVNGFNAKVIKRDTGSKKAKTLLQWLGGCFDALQKKYLEYAVFGIIANENEPNRFLETYSFHFEYSKDTVSMNFHSEDSGELETNCTKKQVLKMTSAMLSKLVSSVEKLPTLPETAFVTMKLYYRNGTPEDYEPPAFQATDDTSEEFSGECDEENLGKIDTNYHTQAFKMYSDLKNDEIEDVATANSKVNGVENHMKKLKLAQESDCIEATQQVNYSPPSPVPGSAQEIIRQICQDENIVPDTENSQRSCKDYSIKCSCGDIEEDLEMVECSKCMCWGHQCCYGYLKDVPEDHLCYECMCISHESLQIMCLTRRTLRIFWEEGLKGKDWLMKRLSASRKNVDKIKEKLIKLGVIQKNGCGQRLIKNSRTAQVYEYYLSKASDKELITEEPRGRTMERCDKQRKASIVRQVWKV